MSYNYQNIIEMFADEPLSEFINVVDYVDSKDKEIYYMQNGYRGYAFEVNPSYFASVVEHKTLLSLLEQNFPKDSAIQILSIPSRNIEGLIRNYDNFHQDLSFVKKPENLVMQNQRRVDWLRKSVNKGLISSKFEFYPKNWRVVISVMIPEKTNKGKFITDNEIVRFKIKTQAKLRDFSPINLEAKHLIALMSEMLEPTKKSWDFVWDKNTEINKQVFGTESKIEIEDEGTIVYSNKRNKKKEMFAKVLTTKSYPEHLSVAITQDLFLENFNSTKNEPYMTSPFFTCLNICVEDKQKKKENLLQKSQAIQWETNMIGEKGMKFFPKLAEVEKEANELSALISTKNETIFSMQYSKIIFSNKRRNLEMQIEAMINKFASINWILQEETDNAFPVMLYSMPFQYDKAYKKYSQKFKTSLKGNNASAAPLLTDAKGIYKDPLMVLFGRTGQIQFFDNFDSSVGNANIVIAAGSRAGKTFTILDYVSQSLSCGRIVRIIEAGANFEAICDEFGGKFLSFREEDKDCLNFFTYARTNKDGSLHSDVIMTVVPLIGLMIGRKLVSSGDDDYSPSDKGDNAVIASYIEKAVRNAFRIEKQNTGLYHVHYQLKLILEEIKKEGHETNIVYNTMIALEPYALKDGAFYSYFNGTNNMEFSDNPLVVFELNKLKERDEGLMFVVLIALIQNIANEFYGDEFEDFFKSLICDEAWMLLDNPFVAAFLIRIWRTIGKHKGAGISISQDLELYYKNKDMEAIYHNSTYKIFLKQDGSAIDGLVRDGKIDNNQFFIDKVKSLVSYPGFYSEMLVQVESDFFISRVIVDKFSFYLYSTPDKVEGYNQIRKKYNLKKNETAWILSYVHDYNCSVENAYDELLIFQGRKKAEKREKIIELNESSDNFFEEEEENEDNKGIFSKIKSIFGF